MIINIILHIINNTWKFFLFIFVVTVLLFFVLTNGIKIEKLNLPKIKISQLYIKLDKKLILNIDILNIGFKSSNKNSIEEIYGLLNKLPYLYTYFKSISIQNMIFDNKTTQFLYKDDIFYVESDSLTLDAKLKNREDPIEIDIKNMILKDLHINLRGNLQTNLKERIFDFKGDFTTFNINGEIQFNMNGKELYYKINTQKFKTLKPFMDSFSKEINLNPIIATWIYKNIVAEEYQLHNLEGKFDLVTYNFYPMLMKGKITGKNASVKFNENVPSVQIDEADVVLKNNQLIFNIKEASYQDKNITNLHVYIYNLISKEAGIIIDIDTNTILDNSIHTILHAYNIKIPLTQTSGNTESNIKLDIRFSPFKIESYTGYFKIDDANMSLSGVNLYSKSGYIEMDNGIIYLQDVNLKYNTLFDIYTSGDYNIASKTYKSDNEIDSIYLNFDKLNLLHVKDINTTATMQIDENSTTINIDSLAIDLMFLKNSNNIKIKNLNLIYPYSKLMQNIDIKDGELDINTTDFNNYEIFAKLKEMNLPLRKNSNQIENIDVNIKIDDGNIELLSVDETIRLASKNRLTLTIKDTDLTFNSSEHGKSSMMNKVTVIGINSSIIDTNSTIKIPSKYFVYTIDGKNMALNSKLNKQTIFIKQTHNTLHIKGEKLDDKFINNLLNKQIFEDGSFALHVDGIDSKKFNVLLMVEDTTIEGLTFYNNLMAFMHTIPSLITFKNPGFNDDGYEIVNARMNFKRHNDTIIINELIIDGKSANVVGSGTMNLKTGLLDIDLQISVLKNLSSIVKVIPVVNYIILGENGDMYTSVNVKGSLDDPKITINAIQDVILSPVGVIKRTLETPFRILKE